MSEIVALSKTIEREARIAADFGALCATCKGAWPGLLYDLLDRSSNKDGERLVASARQGVARTQTDRRLPLPHPIDGDWRFTLESANRVLDLLLSATPATCDVLLIAMPTVALAAYDRGLLHRVVVASRRGDPVESALRAAMPRARFVDLAEASGDSFHTIGIDPPWYDDVATVLIEAAACRARKDGTILICVPDRFTFPSAAERLCTLASAPHLLGLAEAVEVERVRYQTPFFEIRCLQRLGITNVHAAWRTGQLMACRVETGLHYVAGRRPLPPAAEDWTELHRSSVRIWHRPMPTIQGSAPAATVATSISRSALLRASAQLWTSGNTVASGFPELSAPVVGSAGAAQKSPVWPRAVEEALEDELAALEIAVEFR